ncbi:CRISPR-associated endonuclease Cas1 [Thioalkalivibrio sp. ALE14]|uniref:CRISPR-associated endonuclease Cas1 n=1 Tax=Thioalkalivibrio sp. ALE14 TaxID=1158168 RepID=UPI00037E405A|nr:CRISPR-associated endonuclease Cas1 [Thioalkalivibrio sp. ALE14]
MATLYLDRRDIELRLDGRTLTLYVAERREQVVPLALLERIVLVGASIRLSSRVILSLVNEGVDLLFLPARGRQGATPVAGPLHRDAATRVAQARLSADDNFCRWQASDLIRAKLRRQRLWLRRHARARSEHGRIVRRTTEHLSMALAQLETSPPDLARLRGIEGAAARVYFQCLVDLAPDALEFTGRRKRPPPDPLNATLSLAYTLLHFEAVRAARIAGLDPAVGFFHGLAHGRESLASDLIEPLRPLADAWALERFWSRDLRPDHFHDDQGAMLLGKAGRARFFQAWEARAPLARRYLAHATRRLAHAVRETNPAASGAPSASGTPSRAN